MNRGDESNGHSYQWNYYVKIQWRNEERPNEGEILKKGRGLPGLVPHYFHADLGSIHHDIRRNYQIDRLWDVKIKSTGIYGPGELRENRSRDSSTEIER